MTQNIFQYDNELMPKKITHEEFVKNIFKINPNIEILGQYTRSKDNILCKCRICSYEWNTLANNLKYLGCPACGIISRSNKLRKSLETFIQLIKLIHGNKYDYSKVQYINDRTKVIIICPKHGEFEQTPSNHLLGKGCPECAKEHNSLLFRDTNLLFIEKAIKIHYNKYDYSKINYTKSLEKVCIICPKHGEFWQRPNDHLRGKGCPKCSQSHGERLIELYLIDNNIKYISLYKINIDKSINPSGKALIDFFIPELNIAIEYNGELHYIPKEHFGGELGLLHLQLRDNYVRNYCKENNIKLLEIPYTEKDLLIKDTIANFINE